MKVARLRRDSQPHLNSPFGVGGTLPQPALDDLSDVDLTGVSDGDTIVFDDGTDTWVPGTGGSGFSLPWFVVTDYGAVGDGSTDDRAAINAAIAAYNAAGGGVLYFPAVASTDYYYVSNALTALTKPGLVFGDGGGSTSASASPVATDHTTANLFTVSSDSVTFRALRLVNFSTAETAGAAIATTTGFGSHCRYEDLWVDGFRDGLDLIYGAEWSMLQCHITNPVRYGVLITNIDLPDGGDWSMVGCWFGTRSRDATSAIRQESAGGGKVVNLKINANSAADVISFGLKRYSTGYDVAISSSTNATSVLTIVGSSIENVNGDAIKIATTSTGTFRLVAISGIEVSIAANTGRVLNLDASSAGAIALVTLDGVVAVTTGTARAAVSLTNTDLVTLGEMALTGWNARYTSSGDTNTVDTIVPRAHGARVHRSSTDVSVGNNTLTAIAFDAEDYDTDTMHDNATANTRLTIPTIAGVTTGLWTFSACGYTDATTGRVDTQFYLNGTTAIGFWSTPASAVLGGFGGTVDYVCSAGDYVECRVRTSAGAGNAIFDAGNSPFFSAKFIGRVT